MPFLLLAALAFSRAPVVLSAFYSLLLLVLLVALLLLRRGLAAVAGAVVFWCTWLLLFGLIAYFGTLNTPTTLGLLCLVIIGATVWGVRGGVAVAGITVAATLAIAVAETRGWLRPHPESVHPFRAWSVVTATVSFVVVIVSAGLRYLREALADARAREVELSQRLDALSDAVATLDSEGRICSFNAAAERLSGFAAKELVGKSFTEIGLFRAEDLQLVIAEFQALLAGEARRRVDIRLQRKDGETVPTEMSGSLLDLPSGKRVQVIVHDARRRKRFESSLMASHQAYRQLFEEAPLMYVVTRNQDGVPHIDDCNRMFLNVLGYRRDEVLHQPLARFYDEESGRQLLDGGGYAEALQGAFGVRERTLLKRDGSTLQTSARVVPVRDDRGRVVGTRAMYIDISLRKSTQHALQQAEARNRALLQASKEPVLVSTPDGELLDINAAGLELLGLSSEENLMAAGSPARVFGAAESREEVRLRAGSGGFVRDRPLRIEAADAKPLHVLAATTAARDESGRVALYVSILREVVKKDDREGAA